MNIVVANDHGAFALKNELIKELEKRGHTVKNLGVDTEESVDYPDKAIEAALEYKKGGYDFGILLCGSGIGISIAANKVKGIRCALVHNIFTATVCKQHNNANFLAFGGRIKYEDSVIDMVEAFMNASFEGGRHERRVGKLDALC